MKSYEMKQTVIDKVNTIKKVTRVYATFGSDMDYYFAVMNRVNALPRNSMVFEGYPLDQIYIIDALKGIVLPDSVTVSGKDNEFDYLVREEVIKSEDGKDFVFDIDRLRNIVNAFYSIYKTEAPKCTLKDVRVPEALAADKFGTNCSFEGMMVTDEPARFPIPLDMKVFREYRYVFEEKEVVPLLIEKRLKALLG